MKIVIVATALFIIFALLILLAIVCAYVMYLEDKLLNQENDGISKDSDNL